MSKFADKKRKDVPPNDRKKLAWIISLVVAIGLIGTAVAILLVFIVFGVFHHSDEISGSDFGCEYLAIVIAVSGIVLLLGAGLVGFSIGVIVYHYNTNVRNRKSE